MNQFTYHKQNSFLVLEIISEQKPTYSNLIFESILEIPTINIKLEQVFI